MAEPQIIVRTGAGEPPSMSLLPGQPLGPLSIGRRGTWRVVAPGVLEEHGFVYFNGTDLFLQSTDPLSPLLANGSPIPGAWTAIHAPCEIAVGGARLWFGAPEPRVVPQFDDEASALSRQPYVPRVQGNDFEAATRVQPIEETRHARGPLPAAGQPFVAPAPVFGPGATPPLAPPPGAPVAPPAEPSFLAARWREASGPKKALVVLMVPLVWAVWVIFTDAPAPPPRPHASTSAGAQPSAAPRAGASGSASAAPPMTTATTESPVAEAPTGTSSAKAAPSGSPATTGPKTPQREAADAVAAGTFDRAAKLYDELAKAHPEVPAYAEAARIMKAKAGKR